MKNFCITYHLDKENNIVYLSDEWNIFACDNNASSLTQHSVKNRNINEFVNDNKSNHLYELLVEQVRKTGEGVKFAFRCDSAQFRRFMSMEITPLEDGKISMKSCIEREEARDKITLLDPRADRSDEYLTICSWCKQVKVDESSWKEVEEAINRLNLFGAQVLPNLTHGICPECLEYVTEKLQCKEPN